MLPYAQAVTFNPTVTSNGTLAIVAILALLGLVALTQLNSTGRMAAIILIVAIFVVNVTAIREFGIDLRTRLNNSAVELGAWELTGEHTLTLVLLIILGSFIWAHKKKPSRGWIVAIIIVILLLSALSWVATAIIWMTDFLAMGLAAVLSISL